MVFNSILILFQKDFDTGRVTQEDIQKEAEEDDAAPRWKKILHYFT
jgi:hypothetical protein